RTLNAHEMKNSTTVGSPRNPNGHGSSVANSTKRPRPPAGEKEVAGLEPDGIEHHTSSVADSACVMMNDLRGGTSSPISFVNSSSDRSMSLISTLSSERVAGSIVVVHSW